MTLSDSKKLKYSSSQGYLDTDFFHMAQRHVVEQYRVW